MSTSDTPKTDAATQEEYEDLAYLSRQLERENNALRKDKARLIGLLSDAQNGLYWYQEEHPEDASPADDELHAQIDQALKESQP